MNFLTLGSIADIQLGKMLSPKAKTGVSAFTYLRNQNVQWGRLELSDLASMDFSESERQKFELWPGDLLICEGGEPGRCAVWNGELADCYYQKALHRLRPLAGVADAEFLAHWIRYQAMTGSFVDQNAKTTIAHLPLVRLEQLPVPDIAFDHQRRIVERLSAQLAAVEEARQAANAQLRELTQLANAIKHDCWTAEQAPTRKFGEFVDSYRNGFGKRPEAGEVGPIVLRIADTSSGEIDLSSPRRGTISEREARTYQLQHGDLLFIRVNGARDIVGRCCVVREAVPADTIFNDHLIRVRLKSGIDPEFAKLCFSLPHARAVIEEAASTSAGQLTISQQVLDIIEIPDFTLEEQRKFSAQLRAQLMAVEEARLAAAGQLHEIERLPQRLLAEVFDIEENVQDA